MEKVEKEALKAVEGLVRPRGLHILRTNSPNGVLRPKTLSKTKEYLSFLDHYAARLILREAIKGSPIEVWARNRRHLERFCSPDALDGFIKQAVRLGILRLDPKGTPRPTVPVRSFGETFEWYLARLLMRDFSAPAVWGACFSGTESGGDQDVVASLGGRFLYLEVKTGPPKHIEAQEVLGFLKRSEELRPDLAVFLEDTHLRMLDKIVPMMEEGMKVIWPGKRLRLERLEREIFHFRSRLYVVNSKTDIIRNLTAVFRHHFREPFPEKGV